MFNSIIPIQLDVSELENLIAKPQKTGNIPDEIAEYLVKQELVHTAKTSFATKYKYDPIGYVTNKLNWTPWSGQAHILQTYINIVIEQEERRDYQLGLLSESELTRWKPGDSIYRYLSIDSGHNIGKCVYENDLIQLANGSVVEAKRLINKSFPVLSFYGGTTVETVAFASENVTETVYKLTTDKGVSITRNAEHPLWCGETKDWKPTIDFKVGDTIGAPALNPAFNRLSDLPGYTTNLLAHFLCSNIPVTDYAGNYGESYARDNVPLLFYIEDTDTMYRLAYLLKTHDYTQELDRVADNVYKVIATNEHQRFNSSYPELFCQSFGSDLFSQTYRIPQVVMSSRKQSVINFINICFSYLGEYQYTKETKELSVQMSHISEPFIDDLNWLLRRFGVFGSKRKNIDSDKWELYISVTEGNGSKDWHSIRNFFTNFNESASELDRLFFLEKAKQSILDGRIKFSDKGLIFETITSVEIIPNKRTINIEVPENSTFCTMFYEHNTKVTSGIVNHFLDHFSPIIYGFAPKIEQIKDLLMKEIKQDRALLPEDIRGEVLAMEVKKSASSFFKARAANNSSGQGTERVQGQHNPYIMIVIDEAEGIEPFLWGAIKTMISGGIALVVVTRNPRTTSSMAHLIRSRKDCIPLEISCFEHPNVVQGKPIIPGAVDRVYIEDMLEGCDIVPEHNTSDYTFEVPWDETKSIYKPDQLFLWRVFGKATDTTSGNKVISLGKYTDAANKGVNPWFYPYGLEFKKDLPNIVIPEDLDYDIADIKIGVDVSRFGDDDGTIYVYWAGLVWLEARIPHGKTTEYYRAIKTVAMKLKHLGAVSLSVRVDGGGGYGGGVVDLLTEDVKLATNFSSNYHVYEVYNNASPYDESLYADFVTNYYFEAGKVLDKVALIKPAETLKIDLCFRTYQYRKSASLDEDVKILETKKSFKSRQGRSPDDGDGCCLCIAPEYLFTEFEVGKIDMTELGSTGVRSWAL